MPVFGDGDVEWLARLLGHAATVEILPRFRRLSPSEVRHKASVADVVTDADERAERLIVAELKSRFPCALVIGEEMCESDQDLVHKLADAELAFVVDPVDGTRNFARGLPLFGVMLAVVARGRTIGGIIHDPIRGDWLIGVDGAGAFIRSHGKPDLKVRVADPVPVSDMAGIVSWDYVEEPLRSRLAPRQANRRWLWHDYGCAAHEYRLLASGLRDFAVFGRLMPWDHLAGLLIHREAGGHAARFDGSPYLPGAVDGGLLVASSREAWSELRADLWAD